MRKAVTAYPRIGEKRELKKVTEAFFKGNLSEVELEAEASRLRERHWKVQKEKGIDFISSNDFSFYDNLLDVSYLLNIIPKEYQNKYLSEKEIYFAMAKGHQNLEKGIDLKAMEMKKWFNTNYHYIVPQFDDDTEVRLRGSKIFDEYKEAKSLGLETKPVIIGPFYISKTCKVQR